MRSLCLSILLYVVTFSLLFAQSNPDSSLNALRSGDYTLLLDEWSVGLPDEAVQKVLPELGTFFTAEAIHEIPDLSSDQLRAILDIQQALAEEYPEGSALYWHRQRGLTLVSFRAQIGAELLERWKFSLTATMHDMPYVVWEVYVETILDSLHSRRIDPDSLIQISRYIDAYLMNQSYLDEASSLDAQILRDRLEEEVSKQLPTCTELQERFGLRLKRGMLPIETAERLYLMLKFKGCMESDLMKGLSSFLAPSSSDSYILRLLALDASVLGDYQTAIPAIEGAAKEESSLRLYARDLLMLADLHMRRENFRTARVYALRADKAHPTWGEPWAFLAELVLRSSLFCRYTAFERKALYWLAIDYCEQAIGRNPTLRSRLLPQIQTYQQKMPDRETCTFYGLEAGDSFPIRCWLETATTVRYE